MNSSAISSGVTAGLVFEADKPNPTPCLADCAWAVPCKHCDRCFQNPTNWINPSDKCKGTEFKTQFRSQLGKTILNNLPDLISVSEFWNLGKRLFQWVVQIGFWLHGLSA